MNNRIKKLREEKNMNQLRLSTILGVSQETISAYERGKHYPRFSHLIDMSKLFNASVDYIMGLSDARLVVKENELSNNEVSMLTLYRELTSAQKDKALAFIQGQLNS